MRISSAMFKCSRNTPDPGLRRNTPWDFDRPEAWQMSFFVLKKGSYPFVLYVYVGRRKLIREEYNISYHGCCKIQALLPKSQNSGAAGNLHAKYLFLDDADRSNAAGALNCRNPYLY
jgi:hypothetical protein